MATIQGSHFEIEMKSLNSRFLEMSVRLPNGLASKEFELRELLKKYFKRGKIYFSINSVESGLSDSGFVYNKSKIESVMELLRKTKSDFGMKESIKFRHLLAFRDLYSAELPELTDADFENLKIAVGQAAEKLNEMKKLEGAELYRDIFERIQHIDTLLSEITEALGQELAEYLNRFRQRVQDLVRDISPNQERLEYELGLLTEKSDITEECVRLRSHIKFFLESMSSEEPGRKLNFICQELHREVNTITSKSISSDITRSAIAMKEEVERIREQVQNIE